MKKRLRHLTYPKKYCVYLYKLKNLMEYCNIQGGHGINTNQEFVPITIIRYLYIFHDIIIDQMLAPSPHLHCIKVAFTRVRQVH